MITSTMNSFTVRQLFWSFLVLNSLLFLVEASSQDEINHLHHFNMRSVEARNEETIADSVVSLDATETTQLFNISDLAMLSSGCASALAGSLNCSDLIWSAASLYTWGGLTSTNLTNLCTVACNSSIAAFRSNALAACANDIYTDTPANATGFVYGTGTLNDIYNVEGVSVKPIAFVDYYFLNYKLNCMQDDSSPPNYCYELTGNNTTNGTVTNPCGPCELGAFEAQMEDSRTYDESLASEYSSLVSSCEITAPPLTTPTAVFLSDNNTIVANYTTTSASCTGSVVPLPSSSTCDEFAEANDISTDQLLMLNGLQGGCADWPGNLTSLCVAGSCTPYVVQQNDTCHGVAAANNITLTQLLSWNPTIDPICANFNQEVGHIICLSNPLGYTVPNVTSVGVAATGATTAAPVPSSAMAGSNTDCGLWYYVNPGDYCALITNKNSITLSDFYFLNPEINSTCGNLWANQSYCVEAVGDISTYPGYLGSSTVSTTAFVTDASLTWSSLPTATAPSYANATATGYPIANGSLIGCFEMFNNAYGNLSCQDVADMFGVDVADFVRWNPSLLNGANYTTTNCVLTNDTQYCGSFYNQSLVANVTLAYAPVPSDATTNATTQCYDWYNTESGDTCDSICQDFNIPFSSFYSWNPAIGSACGSLWLNTSYCVAGPGAKDVYYGTVPAGSATITSTSTGAPAPTQSGIVANCEEWYVAKSGDGCAAIASTYNISLAQFYAWNPAVGNTCANLDAGDAYCVKDATTLSTTTTSASTTQTSTTTSVTPPGPTQSGIPSNFDAYAVTQSGDGCQAFATRNGITLSNLYLWNPVLDNDCSNFWSGEAYCIGVS